VQRGEESGGSSRLKIDTVNGVALDFERATILKKGNNCQKECFKIGRRVGKKKTYKHGNWLLKKTIFLKD